MKQPGPIALRAIADAERNVGIAEQGGQNRGKAVETYLASVGLPPGNPWCAAFVYYRLAAAAAHLDVALPVWLPRSGYCPDWRKAAQKRGVWIPVSEVTAGKVSPQRGDLCLFYFAAKGRVAHIGIVAEVDAEGCVTVEGNTSDGSGVNRDGGGVYRKRRSWSQLGTLGGFVRIGS